MIVKDNIEIEGTPFIHNYSDSGFRIEREDGKRFSDAKDLATENHTYIETDEPIPTEPENEQAQKAEAFDYPTEQDNSIENKILNIFTNIEEWKNPKDTGNQYNKSDKCYYKEQFWVSTIDNNISEPGSLANTWINI